MACEDSFSVFGADGEEQDGSGTFQRKEVRWMFSGWIYYNCHEVCYNISRVLNHTRPDGRSGRKHLRGRHIPGVASIRMQRDKTFRRRR
jgi:hypothetical protein